MQFHIAAVGRFGGGRAHAAERALFERFAERIVPPPILVEVEDKRPLAAAERRRREAELLLAALPTGAFVVALDERGRQLTSPELAGRLGRLRDEGRRHIAFVIGGADGLDEAVRQAADLVLSLGPMTWPHLLVRGLIAEQIFRAQSILAGHPYHRA
ncbi:MAG: 23S rRNA (pseudouridine(1915)-N(3))-methyltransferase RlmH [Rhodospirillales bacterium]|jgi:23S rRNA (pseudouridine1915-N3)-methyltransferase|nr:23S rRNA (pseudouridine(1915)-N(3))-methyltransferase RlmH [Rhodospirillales bacterium]